MERSLGYYTKLVQAATRMANNIGMHVYLVQTGHRRAEIMDAEEYMTRHEPRTTVILESFQPTIEDIADKARMVT